MKTYGLAIFSDGIWVTRDGVPLFVFPRPSEELPDAERARQAAAMVRDAEYVATALNAKAEEGWG